MKDTTARHFAQLFLDEMAEDFDVTYQEIKAQMPMAQAIVAGLLFEDPEMPEEELAFRFQQEYMNAF